MKNPPILVSVLGFFALAAGISWIVFGLRLLGFDWFNALGDLPQYEQAGLWGWMILAGGAVWVTVGVGLWMVQSWAWFTAMVIAAFNLVVAVIWFFAYPGDGVAFAMALMPIVILLYLNSSAVRKDFELDKPAHTH